MGSPFGDYLLVSYTVDHEHGEIWMRARRRERGEPRETLLRFTGVVAYLFIDETFGPRRTILGHVIEEPLDAFLREHEAEFAAGFARAGWPDFWTGALDDASTTLRSQGVRAWQLTSSLGMSGWVLAASFETFAAHA